MNDIQARIAASITLMDTINECGHLRDVIEDLIYKKKLQQYLKDT